MENSLVPMYSAIIGTIRKLPYIFLLQRNSFSIPNAGDSYSGYYTFNISTEPLLP